jgi:8-oxo-dGTP pyrophosphatase MutT (NUDIX family)
LTELAAAKPAPVRPKHAATLILWRDGPQGPETLMGVRAAGHRFMPNKLVFPGGRVDRGDFSAPAATELAPGTAAALTHAAPARLARALAMAAVRETFEETGLVLGAASAAKASGAWAPFLATGLAPSLHHIDYLCRAITPGFMPIRFNARFLVAHASHATGEIAGNGELEFLRFMPIAEALALEVAPVTRNVLEEFRLWLALPELARAGRAIPLYALAKDSARGRLRL